nr:reverse transcriptase domain-containing protein [Tanacetum cinerariifolium]
SGSFPSFLLAFSLNGVFAHCLIDLQVKKGWKASDQRPILRTGRALVDVYGKELTLRVDDEAITFKVGQTSKYSYNDAESINQIDVIDVAYPIVAPSSPTLTPFRDSDFLLEETGAFLSIEDDSISPKIDDSYYDSEGDIRLLEEFLTDDPSSPLPLKELKFIEPKTTKSSIDKPPELELKDLPSHLYLCNAPGTFQRCMMAIFHDMIEETIEVFMDDFLVFEDSFSSCLTHLDKMLKWCEDTNLVLNREKCHFMVKEGIVLSHKISKSGIEGIDFMGPFPYSRGNKYILVAVEYLSKWVEAKVLPINDARVVVKFLKSFFAQFGTPRAIISDRGTHFCNDQFVKVMLKYGATHRLSTAYHPQTNGQVDVSNRGLKCILERTVGENHASWSDNLDDALWASVLLSRHPSGERKPRKGQNRIKTEQKREACRRRKEFKVVAVNRGRKTEQNAKRMAKNANTVKSHSS